ncbi:MAG: KamA family radical SAM protein [Bdellovibrionales bacterium]
MGLQFPVIEPWPGILPEQWQDWRWQFQNSLKSRDDFARRVDLSDDEEAAFQSPAQFPVQCTPYYSNLIHPDPEDPIRLMVIPRLMEHKEMGQQMPDPLGERAHSPHARVIHRYPDRALFLVTDQCSLYCRYCLRKHFTGQDHAFIGSGDYDKALSYFRNAPGIREVILSGGDPLTLGDGRIERLLFDLRSIPTIEIIRMASRMPVVCPMRITPELVSLFRRFKPVYFITHFNHPRELTLDAAESLERLVDAGVPVFNQMVLLNGINNHAAHVQALSRRLLFLRTKPYYMFQCDPSKGSEHFRTSVSDSLAIQRELWGRLSGLAMPNLSLDIPGGGGKVGLVPQFLTENRLEELSEWKFTGWDSVEGKYQSPALPVRVPSDLSKYLDEWNSIKTQPYGRG